MNMYNKIKTLRIKRGLSQDELASLTGYTHRSSIGKIENGQVDLPQSKIALFANALNTTPQELMGLGEELTEIPLDNIIFDDYFPLHYSSNLSAGSFEELLEHEPDSVVYVPIIFQNKRKRLIAFKVNGTSMDNIIADGSIVVVEHNDSLEYKDGTVIVAYCDGMATVKRLLKQGDSIMLMPDSKDKSHTPIVIHEDKQVYVIGRVIWHMNSENIAKYY